MYAWRKWDVCLTFGVDDASDFLPFAKSGLENVY